MAIKIVTPENLSYFKTKQDAANETKFALKGHKHNAADINSGVLAIANGGTGASTPAAASEALSKFKYAVQLTNENLNDYATGQLGTYYAADGNTCTNKPSGVDGFGMMVIRSNTGHATQILYCNGTQYIRNYDGSAWGTWSTAETSDHKHDAADITSGTLSSDRLPTISVSKGGTGATDAATARSNLRAVGINNDTTQGFIWSDDTYDQRVCVQSIGAAGNHSLLGYGDRLTMYDMSTSDTAWSIYPNGVTNGLFRAGRGNVSNLSRDTLYGLAPGTYLVANNATNGPESGSYGNLLVSYSAGNRIVGLLAYDNGHVYTTCGASSSGTFYWVRVPNSATIGTLLWSGSSANGGTIVNVASAVYQYRVIAITTSFSSTFSILCSVHNNGSGIRAYGVGGYPSDDGGTEFVLWVALRQSNNNLLSFAHSKEFYNGGNGAGGDKKLNITGIYGVV